MWYSGVLPTMAIITGALTAPVIINYHLLKWTQNGNPYRRELSSKFNESLYFRDMRLNGNPYKIHGLDNIPDDGEPFFSGQGGADGARAAAPHHTDCPTTPCPKS